MKNFLIALLIVIIIVGTYLGIKKEIDYYNEKNNNVINNNLNKS